MRAVGDGVRIGVFTREESVVRFLDRRRRAHQRPSEDHACAGDNLSRRGMTNDNVTTDSFAYPPRSPPVTTDYPPSPVMPIPQFQLSAPPRKAKTAKNDKRAERSPQDEKRAHGSASDADRGRASPGQIRRCRRVSEWPETATMRASPATETGVLRGRGSSASFFLTRSLDFARGRTSFHNTR